MYMIATIHNILYNNKYVRINDRNMTHNNYIKIKINNFNNKINIRKNYK